jgi:hypothetical protein
MNETSPPTEGKKNIEIAELRQDTTKKQTTALETRIRYFQEQQINLLQGKFLDFASDMILTVIMIGTALQKIIPEDKQKKILSLYQKLLLAF